MSKDDIIEAFEVIYKENQPERRFKILIYGEENYKNFCKMMQEEFEKQFKIIKNETNRIN